LEFKVDATFADDTDGLVILARKRFEREERPEALGERHVAGRIEKRGFKCIIVDSHDVREKMKMLQVWTRV
jgi:hypothetical protein